MLPGTKTSHDSPSSPSAKSTASSFDSNCDGKKVIIPVVRGPIGLYTFQWYVDNIHRPNNCVHVCHVPDFRNSVTAGMTSKDVLSLMKELNSISDELKSGYEDLMKKYQINGKFVRIGGNNPWSAIVEYSKRVKASMIVMGTKNLQSALEAPKTEMANEFRSVPLKISTVTHDVMLHTQLPVVVVRMPHPEKTLTPEEIDDFWRKGRRTVTITTANSGT